MTKAVNWESRIGRRLRLRDLHMFFAVAECGSMAKASSQLSVSHPVVSKTISELERTLGVRLLDRGSQGVELKALAQLEERVGSTLSIVLRHEYPKRRGERYVLASMLVDDAD
jgi:molybdenum-dependent DNA-binding transcriptional regulator ModE